MAIPFSFLWGYLCDATHRYRFFIMLSFAAVTVLLYLFSLATTLVLLGVLYTSIAIFQVAYEPPKNVLIAETFSHVEWKFAYALYEAWTKLGWVVGLLLGFVLVFIGLEIATLLSVSVFLSLLSFLASAVSVTDPALILERGLVKMERSIDQVHRGATLLSVEHPAPGFLDELKAENASALCVGLVFFSLATNMFLIPLPIFFANNLSLQTSTVFMLFLLNSASGLGGYMIVTKKADTMDATSIQRVALLRTLLVLLFISVALLPLLGAIALSVTVLIVMGFVYAFYSVAVVAASMEVIPQGKAGLFTALLGTGTAIGCLVGPLVADNLGFSYAFAASAACFFLSFVAFKKYA